MLVDERIRDTRRKEEKHKQEERVRGPIPMGPDGKSGETTMPKKGQMPLVRQTTLLVSFLRTSARNTAKSRH